MTTDYSCILVTRLKFTVKLPTLLLRRDLPDAAVAALGAVQGGRETALPRELRTARPPN